VKIDLLNQAIDILNEELAYLDKKEKEKETTKTTGTSGPKVQVTCPCGFFGDEKTENMCSVCYRKKYFGLTKEEKAKQDGKTTERVPCIKGCSFFGDEKFGGMCSVCYKKFKPATATDSKDGSKTSAKTRVTGRKRWRRAFLTLQALRRFQLGKRPEQVQKNRCWLCRRKVGISGIECRCGYIFCGKHRYANEHDCRYDHKQAQRKKIAKENQEIKTQKFEKINDDE